MLEERRDQILAAWADGFLADEQVHEWADGRLMAIPDSQDVPDWLLDLVQHGPAACRRMPEFGWPQPLEYRSKFVLWAVSLDLDCLPKVEEFVSWAARSCIGQDLELPEVQFGYHMDDLLGDSGRMDLAVDRARSGLPELLESCRAKAAEILDLSA